MATSKESLREEFISTQQAARLLGVSVRTIQLWVENGVLHAWKTAGGHRRIARASVDALREEQREVIATVTGLQARKVVIIEDNPTYLELYRIKIEDWQPAATIVTFDSGFEALLGLDKLDPDLIVTELEMPGMNGSLMLQSLRSGAPNAELVVLTNLSDEELEDRDDVPERAAFLRNPVDLDKLGKLVGEKMKAPKRKS
ncbi:MAG TPA: excisionase family DNA-binding protein [Gammaproteobacteria bacterium]|jgi:excisionase family DNA binding protein